MIRLIFELLALYLLYKLIFDFIIPITRTTKQVKKQFGDMQSRMHEQQEQFNQQQYSGNHSSQNSNSKKAEKSDYIDFEEVK